MKFAYFSDSDIWKKNWSSYIWDWPEIVYLAKLISDIFWSINRAQSQKLDLEWAVMPSHNVSIHQHLLKGWRLRNQEQNAHQHQIRMRENGGSLGLTSCRYQVLQQMRTGVYQHTVCCTVYLRKMMLCDWNVLWMVNSLNVSTFCVCMVRLSFN